MLTPSSRRTIEARAVLLGERIETRGFSPAPIVSQNPLAYRTPTGGLIAVFRFGAVVFLGVERVTQDALVESLRPRIVEPAHPMETETATLIVGESDDGVIGLGRLGLIDAADDRLLAVADALAKSVALADDERYVSKVFEQIEPLAQNLAARGGPGLTSKGLLQLLGEALVAQARMVGRVEVEEKPELLWERPDLQRLYARLRDEYELEDRARALSRKLKVIEECARTLSDVTDARRTLRLEIAVVALIVVEIVLALVDMTRSLH